jgi:probable rRNA maturation factor
MPTSELVKKLKKRHGSPVVAEARPRIDAPRRTGGDGTPDVFCSDEQDEVPIKLDQWRALAIETLRSQGVRGACELSIFFVDETTIAELNSEHMGKVGPTDVLAFPLDGVEIAESQGPGALTRGPARAHPDHDDAPILLGDVLICPSVAQAQAPEHAGTLDDELALLVVHGILHVLGFDHDTEDAAHEMRALEREILSAHHWNGPIPTAFRQEHSE